MKFVADENLGIQVPKFLRKSGFDIISVSEFAPGITDYGVLEIANEEKRILITLDKDFGELVFKERLIHSGVILLRLKDESVENKKRVLLKVLTSNMKFQGKFVVISDNDI
ncbi:MAG: DUF5615 family PIN-like protein [bacterium]|nr:DUF5615 family PIN-like protein [bacterium]